MSAIQPRVPKYAPRVVRQRDGTVVHIMPAGGDIGGSAFSGTHTRATTLTSSDTRVKGMLPAALCRQAEQAASMAS